MFSQTVEYALRAVVCLATNENQRMGSQEISAKMDIPQSYVVKVLQQLTKTGIVHSQRGKGGGFSLGRPASEITLLEVISAVDPIPRIKSCPLNLPQHCKALCPLHSKLDESYATLEKSLAEAFVSEMIDKPIKSKRTKRTKS